MVKTFSKIIFLFIFFQHFLYAEETKQLTVDDCIKIGLEHSKTLKISHSKIDYSSAKVDEANSSMLPSLKMSAAYTRLSAVEPFQVSIPIGNGEFKRMSISPIVLDNYQVKLTLSQPLFAGFRLQNTKNLMELNEKAAVEDYNSSKNQLIYDIKYNYWILYNAIESLNNIEDNIKQLQAHLVDIENFEKAGLATLNEVLKVKVQLSNLQVLKVDIENGIMLAMMALNNTIGLPLDTKLILASKPSMLQLPNNDIRLTLDKAFMDRPELKGMEMRVKASEKGVEIAEAGWYPFINFVGNYNFARPNQRIMPTRDQFIGTWDFGIIFSFDIWNWRTVSHQTAQAEATLEQTIQSYEQVKDAVTLDVKQALLSLEKAEEKLKFSNEATKQAEENYRFTNEKFK